MSHMTLVTINPGMDMMEETFLPVPDQKRFKIKQVKNLLHKLIGKIPLPIGFTGRGRI